MDQMLRGVRNIAGPVAAAGSVVRAVGRRFRAMMARPEVDTRSLMVPFLLGGKKSYRGLRGRPAGRHGTGACLRNRITYELYRKMDVERMHSPARCRRYVDMAVRWPRNRHGGQQSRRDRRLWGGPRILKTRRRCENSRRSREAVARPVLVQKRGTRICLIPWA